MEGLQGHVEELEREGEERRAEREREMEAKDQELTQLSLALRDKEVGLLLMNPLQRVNSVCVCVCVCVVP